MSKPNPQQQVNPVMKAVKNFFSKLVKAHDDYPVKYYKRDKQYSRPRQV